MCLRENFSIALIKTLGKVNPMGYNLGDFGVAWDVRMAGAYGKNKLVRVEIWPMLIFMDMESGWDTRNWTWGNEIKKKYMCCRRNSCHNAVSYNMKFWEYVSFGHDFPNLGWLSYFTAFLFEWLVILPWKKEKLGKPEIFEVTFSIQIASLRLAMKQITVTSL